MKSANLFPVNRVLVALPVVATLTELQVVASYIISTIVFSLCSNSTDCVKTIQVHLKEGTPRVL